MINIVVVSHSALLARGIEQLARQMMRGDGCKLALAAGVDDEEHPIGTDALNVMDFEAMARLKLPPAHFGYLITGVDDDGTIAANRSTAITSRASSRATPARRPTAPATSGHGRAWRRCC